MASRRSGRVSGRSKHRRVSAPGHSVVSQAARAALAVYRDSLRVLGVALDDAGPNARARQPFVARDAFDVDHAAHVAFGDNLAIGIVRVSSRQCRQGAASDPTRTSRFETFAALLQEAEFFARSTTGVALFHVKHEATKFQVGCTARRARPHANVAAPILAVARHSGPGCGVTTTTPRIRVLRYGMRCRRYEVAVIFARSSRLS